MFCPYCGMSLQEGSTRCPHCERSFHSKNAINLGSSFFVGATAANQESRLASVVCQALQELGPDVLKRPRVLVAYVMDYVSDEDRIGNAFINNCDEEFLSPFVVSMKEHTPSAIEEAAYKADQLLIDVRSIVDRMAHAVARSVATGIAQYVGVEVSFPAFEPPPPPENTVYCIHCGAENPSENDACIRCGSPLFDDVDPPPPPPPPPENTVYCINCGAENPSENDVCIQCGNLLRGGYVQPTPPTPTPPPPTPNRLVPIVLGVLGALVVVVVAYVLLVPHEPPVDTSADSSGSDVSSTSSAQEDSTDDDSTSSMSSAQDDTNDDDSTSSDATSKEEESHPAPEFKEATASSTLQQEGDGHGYFAAQVLDGDRQTCWAEGEGEDLMDKWPNLSGSDYDRAVGIGSWLELKAATTQYVSGIQIMNGYAKVKDLSKGQDSETYYYDNTRPKSITVKLSDGWEATVDLEDAGPNTWQDISFDGVHPTTYIRITINSVYDSGRDGGKAKWSDTSIDQIKVY